MTWKKALVVTTSNQSIKSSAEARAGMTVTRPLNVTQWPLLKHPKQLSTGKKLVATSTFSWLNNKQKVKISIIIENSTRPLWLTPGKAQIWAIFILQATHYTDRTEMSWERMVKIGGTVHSWNKRSMIKLMIPIMKGPKLLVQWQNQSATSKKMLGGKLILLKVKWKSKK